MKLNDRIKSFLLDFPYEIMHEQSKTDETIEHFFVGIDKEDIKNNTIKQYLIAHTEHYPLIDISNLSMNFLKKNDNCYYVLIDSLNKVEPFYKQKLKFVQNNAANILSIKWTGQPVDISSHLIYNADKYMDEFKDISIFIASMAKNKILTKGKEVIDNNSFIKQKIKIFLKK